MSELGGISGKQTVKALQKIGYQVIRQNGSHVRLKSTQPAAQPLTVPMHPELKIGLLRAIIKGANLTVEEFLNLL